MMTRTIRRLIAGVTVGLACSACTATDTGTARPSGAPVIAELPKLPTVDVAGDPFAELDVTPHEADRRVIGEVGVGSERLIVYTEGEKCGLLATPSGTHQKPSLQLLTSWPKKADEGSSRLPFGPYMKTSGYGSGDTPAWAELSCSKKAAVVNYSPVDDGKEIRRAGSVSLSRSADGKSISVVVGKEEQRNKILSAVTSS
ncbi:hypothetical protein ACIBAG_13045 [Streptomyces sp. NPDC051243]|uniref:hypothetical protein n=1 Tax=Streptomyces sp. NPDC051243 TaxID=3365646 RepID=UPI0037A9902E